jgi:hypothetical protein
LGLAAPVVLDALGKEAMLRHLDANGLTRFLDDQEERAAAQVPGAVAGAVAASTAALGPATTAAPRASGVGASVTSLRDYVRARGSHTASTRASEESYSAQRRALWWAILALGLLMLLTWLFARMEVGERQSALPSAAPAPAPAEAPAASPSVAEPAPSATAPAASATAPAASATSAAEDTRQPGGAEAPAERAADIGDSRVSPAGREQVAAQREGARESGASREALGMATMAPPGDQALTAPVSEPAANARARGVAAGTLPVRLEAEARSPAVAGGELNNVTSVAPLPAAGVGQPGALRRTAPRAVDERGARPEGIGERRGAIASQAEPASELRAFLESGAPAPRRFVLGSVRFEPGSPELRATRQLDQLAKELAARRGAQVLVQAPVAAAELDDGAVEALAAARSEAIKAHLTARGIDASRIRTSTTARPRTELVLLTR